MKLLGLFLHHATEAGACCGEVVFSSPKLITSLIELCCKPGVFAAVAIVSLDKFIDSSPERFYGCGFELSTESFP